MPDIRHRLFIKAAPEKVFEAVTTEKGLSGWWCKNTTAKPEKDSLIHFQFSPDYFKEMRITELKPPTLVKWVCVEGYGDWIGTSFSFELEPSKDGTILNFHHDNWEEYTPMFATCNHEWGLFMRSLRLLCETGKGLPSPQQFE